MMSKIGLVVGLVLLGAVATMASLGGLSEEQPANEDIHHIVAIHKGLILNKYLGGFTEIEPVSYKTQVVSGMNYFIKAIATVANGAKKHIHIRIYKPVEGPFELTAIKTTVNEASPLEYFE